MTCSWSNEEVLYIALSVQHSLIESMTTGALWSMMINQTVFILTNLRLLMVRSNSRGKPHETCWMVYYSEIRRFKSSLTGVLILNLEDRKTYKYTGFSKLDRKTMPAMFEEALEEYREHGFQPNCTQSRENVCGRYFAIVPKGDYECGSCDTRFWRPVDVALRSLIFPAWGDILLKHYPFAAFEVFGYLFTWIVAIKNCREFRLGIRVVCRLSRTSRRRGDHSVHREKRALSTRSNGA